MGKNLSCEVKTMEKLFEQDAYIRQFTARVISCVQGKKGYDVVLDQTAFILKAAANPMTPACWAV